MPTKPRPISAPLLSAPLERLLTCGGDARLRVDPDTMLNEYGCRPWPRPEAFAFSSSTANSISICGYAAADAVREELLARDMDEDALDRAVQNQRTELEALFGLQETGVQIVFSPSGTDAQMLALYVARATFGAHVVSISVAADETGSGTENAITGNHSSSATPEGVEVTKGTPIAGLSEGNSKVSIALRTRDGRCRPMREIEAEVTQAVSRAAASGTPALLYVMDHSKLGSRCPSDECVRQICHDWGGGVRVVVDACQFRLSGNRLKYYLAEGYMVLVTGSKFFGGPPFSGALLVPRTLSAQMERHAYAPAGLGQYSCSHDWPVSWRGIRAKIPSRANIGQILRWAAALAEMREYLAIPRHFRKLAVERFARTVPALIRRSHNLRPLAVDGYRTSEDAGDEMSVRTIFPFLLYRNGSPLTLADAIKVYRALNQDMSLFFSDPKDKSVARKLCHVGQPVGVGTEKNRVSGAIRLSCGSSFVCRSWSVDGELACNERIRAVLEQVTATLDKLELILMHCDALFSSHEMAH